MCLIWFLIVIFIYLGLGNVVLTFFKKYDILYNYGDSYWDGFNDVFFVIFFPLPLLWWVSQLFGQGIYRTIIWIYNKIKNGI